MTFSVYTPTKRRITSRNQVPQVVPPMVDLSEIVSKAAPVESGCGVYFLQRSSAQGLHVVYVGQSLNVYARVAQHTSEGRKRFECWSWIECHESQLDLMESLYIHWLRPVENATQSTLNTRVNDLKDEMVAPIQRRYMEHLLDALTPTNGWRKRRSAA